MVGIRMRLACEHFAYDDTSKSATDALHLFHIVAFKTKRSEHRRKLAGSIVEINIAFEPFV